LKIFQVGKWNLIKPTVVYVTSQLFNLWQNENISPLRI